MERSVGVWGCGGVGGVRTQWRGAGAVWGHPGARGMAEARFQIAEPEGSAPMPRPRPGRRKCLSGKGLRYLGCY
jgi:hypothetical protein